MPGGPSLIHANALLNFEFAAVAYTLPAAIFAAQFTTSPDIDGTGGIEATGNGYARISVTRNATNFPAALAGVVRNGIAIDWAAMGGTLQTRTVVALGWFDALTGGNLLRWGPVGPIVILSGEPFSVPIGGGSFTDKAPAV